MQVNSLSAIKKELNTLHPNKLIDLCVQLAKYKVENKEMLDYLLFKSDDETLFIKQVNVAITEAFDELPNRNLLAKKGLRKILKFATKQIKFTGSKTAEIEILMHYCKEFKKFGILKKDYPVINNMYERQLIKINKTIEKLHEDLQYDYQQELRKMIT